MKPHKTESSTNIIKKTLREEIIENKERDRKLLIGDDLSIEQLKWIERKRSMSEFTPEQDGKVNASLYPPSNIKR